MCVHSSELIDAKEKKTHFLDEYKYIRQRLDQDTNNKTLWWRQFKNRKMHKKRRVITWPGDSGTYVRLSCVRAREECPSHIADKVRKERKRRRGQFAEWFRSGSLTCRQKLIRIIILRKKHKVSEKSYLRWSFNSKTIHMTSTDEIIFWFIVWFVLRLVIHHTFEDFNFLSFSIRRGH